MIWAGDALQVGVDMAGAGAGPLAPEAPLTLAHSAALAFALTTNGPQAFAYAFAAPGKVGPQPLLTPAVVRDESARTTTYDLTLPWEAFQAAPGLWSRIGLAVQVNDTDAEGPQKRLNWGHGGNGPLQPGLLNQMELAWPATPQVSIRATRTGLREAGDSGEFLIAVAGMQERKLDVVARIGEVTNRTALPPAGSGPAGLRRYAVSLDPGTFPVDDLPVSVCVVDHEDGRIVASDVARLESPGLVPGQLQEQLGRAAEAAANPLLARHFESVRALLAVQAAAERTVSREVPEAMADLAATCRTWRKALEEDGSIREWEPYRNGVRHMIFTYFSEGDRSLQYYLVGFPQAWQPDRCYPLIVSLHGSGTSHPLMLVGSTFERLPGGAAASNSVGEAFIMTPWARGQSGYYGLGEQDVLQAIADLERTVQIDDNRVLLMGFSLGGGGAWNLAVRHPDRWAAVAVCSGGPWWAPVEQGYGANLTTLPMLLWHGAADTVVKVTETYEMRMELERYENEPEVRIIKGRGHDLRAADTQAIWHWLLAQPPRSCPARFSFVVPDGEARECRGIRLNLTPRLSLHPRVDCRIDGQALVMTTTGTDGLTARLGEGGLGMTGTVSVVWNGQPAYHGPVRTIAVGKRDLEE